MTQGSNDERALRWRAAANAAMDSAIPVGQALMALADAEQAELRAENKALHRVLDDLRVEVSTDIGEPSRCRVWKGDALVFDGVSTAATIPVAPTVVKGA